MKKVIVVVVGLVAVIALVIGIAASQAGSIIRHAVVKYGPEITGTSVTLEDVDVSILSGRAHVKSFIVGNPKGFDSKNAFEVGQVEVVLDVKSLFSETVKVHKILIEGAQLTVEQIAGKSNIKMLQRNVEQRTAGLVNNSGEGGSGSSSDTAMTIDHIYVNGTRVNLIANLLGEGNLLGDQNSEVTIPDIHLKDIGKEGSGVTPAEVAKLVMDVIAKNVGKGVLKGLPSEEELKKQLEKKMEDKLGDVEGKLKGFLNKKL